MHHDRYARSNGYDPQWVIDNQMGPNAVWLLESLCEVLPIESGMRVLDFVRPGGRLGIVVPAVLEEVGTKT